jgi:hypothetical protein
MKPFFNPSRGYKAPQTASSNQETPFLNIGEQESSVEVDWSTVGATFPLKIVLQIRLYPVFLKDRGIKAVAQLRINSALFGPQGLYCDPFSKNAYLSPYTMAPYSGCEAIELRYEGKGHLQAPFTLETHYFEGLTLDDFQIELLSAAGDPKNLGKGDLVYRKPFTCEQAKFVKESKLNLQDGRMFTTPPGRFGIKRLLKPHSGFYNPTRPIEDIQQLYYNLSENVGQTQINLSLSNSLLGQKLSFLYPEEAMKQGVYFYECPTEEEGGTLTSALQEGYAKLTLCAGEAREIYVSTGYQQSTDDLNTLDVFFVPKLA